MIQAQSPAVKVSRFLDCILNLKCQQSHSQGPLLLRGTSRRGPWVLGTRLEMTILNGGSGKNLLLSIIMLLVIWNNFVISDPFKVVVAEMQVPRFIWLLFYENVLDAATVLPSSGRLSKRKIRRRSRNDYQAEQKEKRAAETQISSIETAHRGRPTLLWIIAQLLWCRRERGIPRDFGSRV